MKFYVFDFSCFPGVFHNSNFKTELALLILVFVN
jgi:hypothetical protein